MVGKAFSEFWILETMPVKFSESQKKKKKIVNQPVQLWECSCEVAEGNDEAEGKLIKWTHHQAESSISTLEDKISI